MMGMDHILETLATYLLNHKDNSRFRMKDRRYVCLDTMIGIVMMWMFCSNVWYRGEKFLKSFATNE